MTLRFIDWIWHIRGTIALAPEQSPDDAFARLAPLFDATGTTHDISGDTLSFCKHDPAAQDKMSIFTSGVLQIEPGDAGPVLRYQLISRTLLACFLAPLLFLGIAQATIAIAKYQKASTEAAAKSDKDAEKKAAAEKAKKAAMPMNPIDKALGMPAPEKPDKTGKDKDDDKDKGPKPTAAYVFAGIFAALYVVGRLLEDWLIKRLFRKTLLGA